MATGSRDGETTTKTPILHNVIGHDGAKAITRGALRTRKGHLLYKGPPASGKSIILEAIEERLPGAVYLDCDGLTNAQLRDELSRNPAFLLLDEFDKLDTKGYGALNTALEDNRVIKSTMREKYDKKVDIQVFAAANALSRIPSDIQSRFRVIEFKPYTKTEYVDVCAGLLPRTVEWITDSPTARKVAEIVHRVLDTTDPRTPRDIAQIAGRLDEVENIAIAEKNPDAKVPSAPVYPEELEHHQGIAEEPTPNVGVRGRDNITVLGAETEDMAKRATQSEFEEITQKFDEAVDVTAGTSFGGQSTQSLPQGSGDVVLEIDEDAASRVVSETQSINEALREADEGDRIDKLLDIHRTDRQALSVYLMDEHHDDIHALIAELQDEDPDRLYDHSEETEKEGFDRVYEFDLKRSDHGEPWSPTNWNIDEFIEEAESRDLGPILIESGVFDLQ